MKWIFVFLLCAGLFSQKMSADLKEELKGSLKIEKLRPPTESDFFVFISLGMSDEILLSLANEAEKVGGTLILRGLPNNSFRELAKRMLHLKEKGLSASIQIHPAIFQEYGVTGVPAFVLKEDANFEKVSGNISIEYVLELFEGEGSLKAKAMLNQFRKAKNA